jgi:hypothetical protein
MIHYLLLYWILTDQKVPTTLKFKFDKVALQKIKLMDK